ncbi:hypothetical protein D9757_004941 [Collybiopsis confluens]|uniref:Actin n=1 Tax=Collybiopsis confluens TaxID=2823264 RepID=A0A8H5MCS8_9AGAR|nr:hypothetical protein D9757_004941 [Collybiopsis confluens]
MEDSTVIVDNVSGVCKAGFAVNDAHRATFPYSTTIEMGHKDSFVGIISIGSQDKRGVLTTKYPIEHGIVTS